MCKKCGKPILVAEISRSTTCDNCGADLHSCINCKFYSPGSYYDCHESIDELVKDKERANFCDSFSVLKGDFSGKGSDDKAQSARDAFAALFGRKKESSRNHKCCHCKLWPGAKRWFYAVLNILFLHPTSRTNFLPGPSES